MMHRTLPMALLVAGVSACFEGSVGQADSEIIGGQSTTGDAAVVLLVSYPADHSVIDTCTATIIAPTVVLTAAHCVDPATHPGYTFGIFLGPDASAYTTVSALAPQLVPVQATHMHPAYDYQPPFNADIGVAVLAQPVTVTPLPILRSAPTSALVGQPTRIVGYGQTTYGQLNSVKHEATTVIAAIDPGDTITVGDTVKRSCVGDSGGPALAQVNGQETIVGEDSYADLVGCVGPAHYRRTDLYLAFIDQYAPPVTTTASTTTSTTSGQTSSATGSGSGGSSGGQGGSAANDAEGSSGCAVGPRAPARDFTGACALLVGGLASTLLRRRSGAKRSPE